MRDFQQDVLNLYAKKAQEVSRADGAALEEIEGDDLVYRAATGSLTGHLGLRLVLAGSYSGQCYATRKPLVLNKIDLDVPTGPMIQSMGIKSMLLIPVIWGDRVLAVLKVSSGEEDHFTEADTWKLESLTSMAAETLISVQADLAHDRLKENLRLQQEISMREKAHSESLEAHQRFIDRVNAVLPCVMYVYDLNNNRNIWCSREIANMIGYNADEIKEMGSAIIERIIHPDDVSITRRHLKQFKNEINDIPNIQDFRAIHKNGATIWGRARRACLDRNSDGTCATFVGVFTLFDIPGFSEPRNAAELIAEAKAVADSEK